MVDPAVARAPDNGAGLARYGYRYRPFGAAEPASTLLDYIPCRLEPDCLRAFASLCPFGRTGFSHLLDPNGQLDAGSSAELGTVRSAQRVGSQLERAPLAQPRLD